MNRRGFLLAEETLKIVIALICIGFLVYFLGALYSNSRTDSNLELAEASLEKLISEADSFGGGGGIVEIYNPSGWFIVSWPQDYTAGYLFWKKTLTGKTNYCENMGWENCLCICEGTNPDSCDDKGICRESGLSVVEGIKIEKPLPVKLNIKDGVISK